MANAFASLGHEVTLFVSTRKTHIAEDPESYYGVRFAFKVVRTWIPDIVGRIHSFPKFFHAYLYTLERVWFGMSFVLATRTTTFDLLYCRDEWVLCVISFFRPSQKIVWESHEAVTSYVARRVVARHKTVVISEGVRDVYRRLNVPENRLLVARGAIDDRFFEPLIAPQEARQTLALPHDKPLALYIGGFDEWKGVHTFFKAAELIPQVRCVAIGGTLDELSMLRNLYPSVTFLGPRPYRELSAHQRAADVLVIPNTSRNAHSSEYTSPLKLFAHMTSGVPLVLSDIASLRSVLTKEEAFFCTPDDPGALAHAIVDVITHPDEALQRAEAARKKAATNTWQNRARAILDFIAAV
jgi:glycosyltransferase involved in cell wall biosynthesis